MSLLIGPRLLLKQSDTRLFHFPLGDDQIQKFGILKKSIVCTQWEELSRNVSRDHWAILPEQARGFLGHLTSDNAFFF